MRFATTDRLKALHKHRLQCAPGLPVLLFVSMVINTNSIGQSSVATGLFAQSAQAVLSRITDLPETSSKVSGSTRLSWLLLDARSGQLLASQWPHADQAIPMGSLTKPFVALAYARTHHGFPLLRCAGAAGRCWLSNGHGTLGFEQALAYSCNSYFLQLARDTSSDAMDQISLEYGLPAPSDASTPDEQIGLASTWRIAPIALGQAYARLALKSQDLYAIGSVRNGMRLAATSGTARALIKEGVLAKTGTARCVQNCSASGGGFVVALSPSDNPRLLLLVRDRGTTGAATAAEAARMLRALRAQHVIAF